MQQYTANGTEKLWRDSRRKREQNFGFVYLVSINVCVDISNDDIYTRHFEKQEAKIKTIKKITEII